MRRLKRSYTKSFLWIVMTVCSTSLLLSCNKKNENEEPDINSELVGKWYLDNVTYEIFPTVPELSPDMGQMETYKGEGEYWVFTSTTLTTYDSNGQPEDDPLSYYYDQQSKKLIIEDMESDFTVLLLNENKLVLYAEIYEGLLEERITIEFNR